MESIVILKVVAQIYSWKTNLGFVFQRILHFMGGEKSSKTHLMLLKKSTRR